MTNPHDQGVLIVDVPSAGLRTPEALRRGGHSGRLTLVHGLIPPGARTEIVDGDPADERFLALAYNDDRLVGVLGWGMPKQARLRRQQLVDQISATVPVPG